MEDSGIGSGWLVVLRSAAVPAARSWGMVSPSSHAERAEKHSPHPVETRSDLRQRRMRDRQERNRRNSPLPYHIPLPSLLSSTLHPLVAILYLPSSILSLRPSILSSTTHDLRTTIHPLQQPLLAPVSAASPDLLESLVAGGGDRREGVMDVILDAAMAKGLRRHADQTEP